MAIEQIIFFQTDQAVLDLLKDTLAVLRIRSRVVPQEQFMKRISDLMKGRCGEAYAGSVFSESLMLMCNLTEKHMNRVLAVIREKGIRIDFKAALTPVNQNWTVLELYREMEKERAMYRNMGLQ